MSKPVWMMAVRGCPSLDDGYYVWQASPVLLPAHAVEKAETLQGIRRMTPEEARALVDLAGEFVGTPDENEA